MISVHTGAVLREHFSHHLNCGIVGAAMFGCGSGAILEALPTPLGSTAELFIPPAFAGPRAIPLIGTFPIAPEPAGRGNPPIAPKPACPPRANEAAGGVKTRNNAIARRFGHGSAPVVRNPPAPLN